MTAAIHINRHEGSANLSVAVADAQRIEQLRELRLGDATIAVGVDALEAIAQRIGAHVARVRCFPAPGNVALVAAIFGIFACRGAPAKPEGTSPDAAMALGSLHPPPSASAPSPSGLPALRAEWIEALPTRSGVAAVTPPVGATAPSRVVVGVHGAGDRPEWSCGGWRLASQNSAFVVCPRGRPLSASTFAWSSTDELERRSEDALAALYERYGAYVDMQDSIFAGFSQGATLAGTYLRAHAARFPIAILAEGGYALLETPAFTRAFYAGGGRRLVLVCGTPGCFARAHRAKSLLAPENVEILVLGDEKAGHNLNERLQRALQDAWSEITAPLPPPSR